jgi:hypothetical protein
MQILAISDFSNGCVFAKSNINNWETITWQKRKEGAAEKL